MNPRTPTYADPITRTVSNDVVRFDLGPHTLHLTSTQDNPVTLFPPAPPPPNPHHPFVYLNGEIRHVGDLGDRYEADVWLSRDGSWKWTARSCPPMSPDDELVWTPAPGLPWTPTEDQAVTDAVAWLRARCVAVHGRCG